MESQLYALRIYSQFLDIFIADFLTCVLLSCSGLYWLKLPLCTDWPLAEGSESAFIKHDIPEWPLSSTGCQNRHHNWNFIFDCKNWELHMPIAIDWLFGRRFFTLAYTYHIHYNIWTGRYCSRKNICRYEKLPSRWKQRNDGYWPDEHGRLLFLMFCHHRYFTSLHS